MGQSASEIQEAFAATIIDAAIRVLYNSEQSKFREIFGEKGDYLYKKFKNNFDSDEGKFICYLDTTNKRLLAREAIKYAVDPTNWKGE